MGNSSSQDQQQSDQNRSQDRSQQGQQNPNPYYSATWNIPAACEKDKKKKK